MLAKGWEPQAAKRSGRLQSGGRNSMFNQANTAAHRCVSVGRLSAYHVRWQRRCKRCVHSRSASPVRSDPPPSVSCPKFSYSKGRNAAFWQVAHFRWGKAVL